VAKAGVVLEALKIRTVIYRGGTLNFIGWLGVVSGLITVLSFIFAVWVWMRSDMRVRELSDSLQSIYEISGNVLWETVKLKGEDTEAWMRQAERAIGLVSSIHTLSSKYAPKTPAYHATELGTLIERGIVWTPNMLWNVEMSPAVKEVWLITPDFKPDISDPATGALVGENLRKGKKYSYFIPPGLEHVPDLIARLNSNLGIASARGRLSDRVTTIQLDAQEFWTSLGAGNIIFFFRADSRASMSVAFREIIFTKVSERGLFWQECSEGETDFLYSFLRRKLEEQASSH
jgi:hypothetical protein